MSFRDWTFVLAAVGNLALALVSTARAGKSPLALPLAMVAFDFFGWTAAAFCHHQLGGAAWGALDATFTALGPALVLHFVLAFVGQLRTKKIWLATSYLAFGALALSSLPAIFTTPAWIDSAAWSLVFLAGWMPTVALEGILLARHLEGTEDADEQARTRLVLAALVVGAAFASTDLVHDLGAPIVGLAALGTILSTFLLAAAALKLSLFGKNLATTTTLYALAVAASAVVLYLTLFQGLKGNLPALTFAITLVTLALTAVVREAATSLATYRERIERLAVLGRFSAQMAHDLKNPLAALVGAVQVLEADPPNGGELRSLISLQADRIRTIVDKYDRLGRVEPACAIVRVHDLVKRVAALQTHAVSAPIEVHLDLAADVVDWRLDSELVSGALENLIRNAFEAMPNGGRLRIGVRRDAMRGRDALVLSVSDTGHGIDARNAERAFDDFHTTKATGSGLGLAFVRRVALAHDGEASLSSREGEGTTVEIRIPKE